jgi:hypothetical protein
MLLLVTVSRKRFTVESQCNTEFGTYILSHTILDRSVSNPYIAPEIVKIRYEIFGTRFTCLGISEGSLPFRMLLMNTTEGRGTEERGSERYKI